MCVHVIHVSMPGGWEAQYAVHTHEQWVGERVCVRVCVCVATAEGKPVLSELCALACPWHDRRGFECEEAYFSSTAQ